MAYKEPGYTQIPNVLLDDQMQEMSKAELKIVLATCRKTFGWQKGKDRISYSQFERLTGLSRASVREGIKQAVAHGYLRRYEVRNGFEYSLVIDTIPEIEPPSELPPVPEFEPETPQTIPEFEHTKESTLKKSTGGDFLSLSINGKNNPINNYPADVQDLLQAFVTVFKRMPVPQEKAGWIKEARKWRGIGIKSSDINPMYKHCKDKGLAIKSPFSITFAYDELRQDSPVREEPKVRY